jgi:hypothetical protein
MPIDTANLMGEVYSLFASIYTTKAADQAFLSFEALGIPISDGMFKLNPSDTAFSPPLAVERLSDIANKAVMVSGGAIARGMATVDGTVSLFLEASAPVDAGAMDSLGAAKQNANANFDVTLGSMDGVPNHRFHPVYASPVDWYDPTASANWTSHHVGEQQTPAQAPPPPPAPIHPPVWRVLPLDMRPALSQEVTLVHPFLAMAEREPYLQIGAEPVQVMPVNRRVMPQRNVEMTALPLRSVAAIPAAGARFSVAGAAASAAAPQVSLAPAVEAQMIQPLLLTTAVAAVGASATPQPVAANSIDISFDHCVVMLERSWFPDTLLMLRNWYLPNYRQGGISNGTGVQDPGPMPVVATGFVAVRNLKITSNWSEQELPAAQGSASFGPFSLVGRSFDAGSGTLACPGIQIIGWFCSALPVLPPASDPALAASTSTPAAGASDPGATLTPSS